MTISYELLSVDNFASFYLIHSNICSESSLYVSFPHKFYRMNFEPIRRQELQKNPIFVIQYISLLFRHLGFYMHAPHAIGIRQQSMFIITMVVALCAANLCLMFLSVLEKGYCSRGIVHAEPHCPTFAMLMIHNFQMKLFSIIGLLLHLLHLLHLHLQ